MKRTLSLLLSICLLLALLAPALAEGEITVTEIQKYGNLVLSLRGTEFLGLGYAYGDIVTATINGVDYEMPVGGNYSDVDQGSMMISLAAIYLLVQIYILYMASNLDHLLPEDLSS